MSFCWVSDADFGAEQIPWPLIPVAYALLLSMLGDGHCHSEFEHPSVGTNTEVLTVYENSPRCPGVILYSRTCLLGLAPSSTEKSQLWVLVSL